MAVCVPLKTKMSFSNEEISIRQSIDNNPIKMKSSEDNNTGIMRPPSPVKVDEKTPNDEGISTTVNMNYLSSSKTNDFEMSHFSTPALIPGNIETPKPNLTDNNDECRSNRKRSTTTTMDHSTPVTTTTMSKKHKIVNAQQICSMVKQLFDPNEKYHVLKSPSISSRIFASFVCTRVIQDSSLQPILTYLQSLVLAEVVSLGPQEQRISERVQFSGHDMSSMRPPIDRDLDSASHQQEVLDAMTNVKEEMQKLSKSALPMVRELIHFLNALRDDPILHQCSDAVTANYPRSRVARLASQLRGDFEILQNRLEKLPNNFLTPLQLQQTKLRLANGLTDKSQYLSVEKRLGERLGQGIRYHLRRMFNGPPPRLTRTEVLSDEEIEKRDGAYSQVFALVQLEYDDGKTSTVVEDGCISALISTALQSLECYFGLQNILTDCENVDELGLIPTAFCASEASRRGQLPCRSNPPALKISKTHLQQLKDDINEVAQFLSAFRATRFLLDLLSIKSVQGEIQRMGGWDEIQSYSTRLWNFELYRICPADSHLIALSNVETLANNLHRFWNVMNPRTADAEQALKTIFVNYRLSTRSENVKSMYPEISDIAILYHQAIEFAYAIPQVKKIQH